MPVMNMVQALNLALREEMRRDPRVIVLGEDVGKRGGVFLVTEGLLEEFGEKRVIDTPLTEMGIIGIAIGLAMYGFKPVAEIQFIDFVYEAFDQIVSEVAKMRAKTGGMFTAPIVIRAPCCGGVKGAMHHSQSPEAYFIHTAGLVTMMPSRPYDAKGMLKAAIRSEDPVVFLEPKSIYRTIREEVPEEDYVIPIGKGRIAREGSDVTIVTYGAMVHVSVKAAELAEKKRGWSVEVIDLRTLFPFDRGLILKSLEKTGRLIIVHEAPRTLGFGAEIAAYIAEKAIDLLRGPVIRVTGYDTPFPLVYEKLYMPNVARIYLAIEKVMRY
jgi:pyruvate/2-oxoglutarate/acetoin dehydrogenase E1 component